MTDVLNVTLREDTGTKPMRRLRRQGSTPAILYGHGEANVNLSVLTAELESAIRQGVKMFDLSGALSEKALLRSVQWDAFGSQVLHLDLSRVSESETVAVNIPLELRGEAPGSKLGGIIDHHLFDVEIECPAGQIPDKLTVSIKELGLGESITVGAIPLPENVVVLTSADAVVVACQAPVSEEEEEGGEGGAAEPEVIGRKAEDEDGDSD